MPVGPEWICDIITIVGDEKGPDGQLLTEEVELWRRNPVDCCKDLIGNPAFLEYIAYSPMRVTRDGSRYYGEMNTAEWWWDMVPGHLRVRLSGEYQQAIYDLRRFCHSLDTGVAELALNALTKEEERHKTLLIQPHRKGLVQRAKTKKVVNESAPTRPAFGRDYVTKIKKGSKT